MGMELFAHDYKCMQILSHRYSDPELTAQKKIK